MGIWNRLFRPAQETGSNPAIKKLHHHFRKLTPKQSEAVRRLPTLAVTLRQGADYIYQRVILDLLQEYDARFQAGILSRLDEERKRRITEGLIHFMMVQVYADLTEFVEDRNMAGLLADAVHFELFGDLPKETGSFVEYFNYDLSNFEDPSAAPAYKFGHDLAALTGFAEMSLPLMLSQQSLLVAKLTNELTRLALSNETLSPGAAS
jgi:hypothetical protein